MAVEVRQMIIKSTVGEDDPQGRERPLSQELLARTKDEILEECRAWFLEQLRLRQER